MNLIVEQKLNFVPNVISILKSEILMHTNLLVKKNKLKKKKKCKEKKKKKTKEEFSMRKINKIFKIKEEYKNKELENKKICFNNKELDNSNNRNYQISHKNNHKDYLIWVQIFKIKVTKITSPLLKINKVNILTKILLKMQEVILFKIMSINNRNHNLAFLYNKKLVKSNSNNNSGKINQNIHHR